MAGPVCLHFTSAPAIAPAYLKILLARKPALATGTVPRIEAVLERFAQVLDDKPGDWRRERWEGLREEYEARVPADTS